MTIQRTWAAEDGGAAAGATTTTTPTDGATHAADGLAGLAVETDDGANGSEGTTDAGSQGQGDGSPGEGQANGGKDQAPNKLTFDAKPEWLPENFWDKDSGEVKIEALAKSQRDLRAQLSKGDKVPDKATDYKVALEGDAAKLEESLAAEVPDLRDGVLQLMHEAGLGQEKAAEMYPKVLELLDEALGEKLDPAAEMQKLGKRGQDMVNALFQFGKTLVDRGILTPEQGDVYNQMWRDADSAMVLQAIRESYGELPLPTEGHNIRAASDSAADLRREMGELMKAAGTGDMDAQRKFERLQEKYNKIYGDEAGGFNR